MFQPIAAQLQCLQFEKKKILYGSLFVSASDAHGWLAKRLMHMVHFSGNTSVVSKSSSYWLNYTAFPGDVCVAFFNVLPGNKDAMAPNSLAKEDSHCVTNVTPNAYQSRLNAEFPKVCEIFEVCAIESLKYIREFHTPVCYCGDISDIDPPPHTHITSHTVLQLQSWFIFIYI